VKVLFDQNVPRPLAGFLAKHGVTRSAQLDWEELTNHDLIEAAASSDFDVLVTADRNLGRQQNLEERGLAIVVLPSGQWPEVKPHVPLITRTVDDAQAGTFTELPPVFPKRRNRPRLPAI